MSKIYSNATIFCPCYSDNVDEAGLPTGVGDSTLRLGDVYFCPRCQIIRCEHCCHYEVECKYCPNCFANYSDSTGIVCTKNCFDCPLCCSTLSITVSDDQLDGKLGKRFKFACLFCSYYYRTQVVTKPKSLRNIIRGESKKSTFFQLYAKVQSNLIDNYKLDSLSEKVTSSKPKLSDNILQRLKHMQMTNIQKDTFDEIDVLRDKIKTNHHLDFDIESMDLEAVILNPVPLSKPLMAKRSLRCGTCSTPLVVPTPDPLLIKYLCKWNALEFLPNVIVSNVIDKPYPTELRLNHLQSFIINLVNPLLHDLNVSMSILSELPHNFISHNSVSHNYSVQLSLPVTDVTVGSVHDKNSVIKSIPTPLLTRNSKASRAELLMRLGKLNTSNMSPDDSADIETSLIERGANWVLLPFSIVCTSNGPPSSDSVDLKVPFYVIVESKLPESIKALKLLKRGLKYGFWTVVNLGKFSIMQL